MDHPTLLAALALTGYATFYLLMCVIFPYAHCRRCDGSGKRYSPFTHKVFRLCRRCDGTGRRVRIGRRIYESLRGETTKGTR